MQPTTKVILLSGQTATYRTAVANALSNILADSLCRHAILNADELRQKWPADNEYRFALYNGLFTVWPAFRAKICHRLIMFGETVVAEAQELDNILEMAHADDLIEERANADINCIKKREPTGDIETKGFTLDAMKLMAIEEKPLGRGSGSLPIEDAGAKGLQVSSPASVPRLSIYVKESKSLAAEMMQMFDKLGETDERTTGASLSSAETSSPATSPPSSTGRTNVETSPSATTKTRPWSSDHYWLEALPMITTAGKDPEGVAMEIYDCVKDWI